MKMNKKALTVAITMSLLMGMNSVAMAAAYGQIYGVDGAAGTTSVRDANYDSIEITTTSGTAVNYYDNYHPDKHLSNHSFTINKGTWYYVFGGYSKGSDTVSSNTVTVSGGEISGYVFGGESASGTAKDNTINLGATDGNGCANINGDVYINANGDVLAVPVVSPTSAGGGTLNVYSVGNKINAGTVSGTSLAGDLHADKANVNFYIPATAKSGDTMVTVAGTADLTDANVKAGVQTGSKLMKGDKITLIDANKITGSLASATTMTEAGYNKYKLGINVIDNDLVAEVLNVGAGENAKSPLETMAASLSMLNMGGDMLAGAGLESAVEAANRGEIFAAIGNSNARVNSGSHVDVNGTTFNLGFAKAIPNESGKLVIGPVVEYGTGKYDSYLDNGYHGDGKSKYWGVGLVAKQLNDTGVYYEGSLRGGKVTNDYSAADGSFDSSALYIAAHLGVGKVFQLNEKNNVDVYGKYFFTHQGGDNVVIDGNEFDFKNANSNRARLGARYNYNINAKNTLYGGLAWQYEFSGETAGSMGEDSIEAPSLKGHTGILELGWKVAPTKSFEMKLGMSAYTGVERGGSASVKLNWKF